MKFSGFEVLSTIHEQMKQLKELPERFGSCRLILTTFIGCKYRPCDLYVPDNVEKIDARAFEDCRNLLQEFTEYPSAHAGRKRRAGRVCGVSLQGASPSENVEKDPGEGVYQ